MKTVKDVFDSFRSELTALYPRQEADAIALLAIGHVTGFSNAKIKAFPEQGLSDDQLVELTKMLPRLKTGEPIQYILGQTEFYGLTFNVTPSVLIPRPETEELVEWILSSVGSEQLAVGSGQWAVGSILDIGTGSGCIAISLKKNLPDLRVQAIDISDDALEIAKVNARLNKVEVDFINQDILSINQPFAFHLSPFTSKYDIIVSNPPYVTLDDKTRMHQNVTDFEPHTALFVPEDDPLIFYKAITDFALVNLNTGGQLYFEINESYGEETVQLLHDKGFADIELRKDMSGRDRMIRCVKNH